MSNNTPGIFVPYTKLKYQAYEKVFLAVITTCTLSVPGFAQQRVVTYVNGKSTIFSLGTQPELQELGKAVMEFMYDYQYLT